MECTIQMTLKGLQFGTHHQNEFQEPDVRTELKTSGMESTMESMMAQHQGIASDRFHNFSFAFIDSDLLQNHLLTGCDARSTDL